MTLPFLSADRLSWSMPIQHGSSEDRSKATLKFREKILARDDYTCQGCGWRCKRYQELHHKDGDHSNFKESNLETLCPLCHQLFHPAAASLSGGGVMIWLPEITQAELNRWLFSLFAVFSQGADHPLYATARAIRQLLDQRRIELDGHMGKSDPAVFGQVLLRLSPEDYAQRHVLLAPVKMLAQPQRFKTEIDYWATQVASARPNDAWTGWAEKLGAVQEPPAADVPAQASAAERLMRAAGLPLDVDGSR